MSRYLFVGDPHVTPDDLEDAKTLGNLIIGTAIRERATVVLLGDLYHTHGVIYATVQLFWWMFFEACKKAGVRVVTIKGNHDADNVVGSRVTSLLTHYYQGTCVLYEPYIENALLFCPYTDGAQLVKWSEEHPECGTLVCHQTFDGSRYENGFFAGDGVDPNLIKQRAVISGHIHTPQEFFKVTYIGAPRWRTLGDANVDRAIWILDFDDNGILVKREPIDTGTVCRRIIQVEDTPARPFDLNARPAAKDVLHVEIRGPQAWLDERRPLFEGWARTRGVRTDSRQQVKVRESDGVGVAFEKYADSFVPRHGTERDVLKKMVKERVNGW
jgi:DNA repair exonuclease SbcCD nuclease subunit